MNISIICYPTHGGSGVIASELALGLARRGHTIHIVSYATPFRLHSFSPNIRIHEVEMATYPLFKYPPYTLGLATKLAEVASEEPLDIIHAHYAVPHAVSAFLAREVIGENAPKIVTTLHGTDITLVGGDESFHRVIKFAMEVSDAVTAVSHYLRQLTIEEFSLKRSVEVIHNFVDTKRAVRDGNCIRSHWAPNNEKVLMHASNFRPVKRVSDVIRVFERVLRRLPAKLLLVGEGPERLFSQQLVRELKLNDHVYFLGEQDYLENILSCADVFLLPSEQESFGLVALEAMSCKVPVIGTNIGGVPEVVTHGKDGYLFPVGAVKEMADSAVSLLSDERLHMEFAERARRRAVTHFDVEKLIPRYEALYERVLEG